MAANKKVLMLPGDGIGPEVMGEVGRVMDWMAENRQVSFDTEEDIIGGACIDAHGVPMKEETIEAARTADAVLLGAVGGPKWDNVDFDIRPEAGLLQIRKELGLFANLRPAIVFDALADASSLKREIVAGLDILIVRELTGGIYFGEPRGVEDLSGGGKRGYNSLVYTTPEVERIARVGFELAMKRNKKLCSIDKANVLESTRMWREEVIRIAPDYPDVDLSHMQPICLGISCRIALPWPPGLLAWCLRLHWVHRMPVASATHFMNQCTALRQILLGKVKLIR